MAKLTWRLQPGTPHYRSDCGRYVALYAGTSRKGFGTFRVYRSSLSAAQRKARNALAIGGLPSLAYWERRSELPEL